jgi:hypothetical protein
MNSCRVALLFFLSVSAFACGGDAAPPDSDDAFADAKADSSDPLAGFVGEYAASPLANPWQGGALTRYGAGLLWRNYAGVEWRLSWDQARGRLVFVDPTPYPGEWFDYYQPGTDAQGRPSKTVLSIHQSSSPGGEDIRWRVPFTLCPTTDSVCGSLRDFYYVSGGTGAFSQPFHEVIDTSVLAWIDLQAGRPASAKQRLDQLWADFPRGSSAWDALSSGCTVGTCEHGSTLDVPPGQMVALMLTRVAESALAHPGPMAKAPLQLTVAIASCARATLPANQAELLAGTGTPTTAKIDPAILARNFAVLRQALAVFQTYIPALFGGRATVQLKFVVIPATTCFDVGVSWDGSRQFSEPTDPNAILGAVPAAVRDATDWWLVVYPTLIPADPNNFDSNSWILGGSSMNAPNGAVLIISDDHGFLRKPPDYVSTPHTPFPVIPYQSIERFFYHPRWLDHEVHHHFFDVDFPEMNLEVPAGSHSWFDRSTWPADFVGQSEPEYFDQADFLRFQTADPPIWFRDRFAAPNWRAITDASLVGRYEACRDPSWSDTDYAYNKGSIVLQGGVLSWTNDAGVTWHLQSWQGNSSVPKGQVLQVDGPYAGEYLTFRVARNPSTGANTTSIAGYDNRQRCPAAGCACP